ncbi:glycoside hydrolase family 52 protein [Ktedonobacter sp. SOSP1-52]|uniref:glycoside hydrolase family 52 protein n=1 Tax=Ktedonobacter sp. SOSP1-52 TaxID=2778366 RepID=UPI001914F01A
MCLLFKRKRTTVLFFCQQLAHCVIHFPDDFTEHSGGISFTHDMEVPNVFSPLHYSASEMLA